MLQAQPRPGYGFPLARETQVFANGVNQGFRMDSRLHHFALAAKKFAGNAKRERYGRSEAPVYRAIPPLRFPQTSPPQGGEVQAGIHTCGSCAKAHVVVLFARMDSRLHHLPWRANGLRETQAFANGVNRGFRFSFPRPCLSFPRKWEHISLEAPVYRAIPSLRFPQTFSPLGEKVQAGIHTSESRAKARQRVFPRKREFIPAPGANGAAGRAQPGGNPNAGK